MAETHKSQIDVAFDEISETFGSSKVIRREMIENLRKQASKMEINFEYDKPMLIQSKLMVLKTLDDIIKSDEDVSVKKLKLMIARKDSETNGEVGATIVNLLKNIRATGEVFPEDKGEVDRDAALKDLNDLKANNPSLTLTKGELEECGSSPSTDSNDAPIAPLKKDEEDE